MHVFSYLMAANLESKSAVEIKTRLAHSKSSNSRSRTAPMAPEHLLQSICLAVLVVLFLSLTRQADASNFGELYTRFCRINRENTHCPQIMLDVNNTSCELHEKCNKIMANLETSTARLHGLEHRMNGMMSSIQEANKRLKTVTVAKDTRSRTERVATGQAPSGQEVKLVVAVHLDRTLNHSLQMSINLTKRFDRFEKILNRVESKLKVLEGRPFGSQNACVGTYHFDQLYQSTTNDICALSATKVASQALTKLSKLLSTEPVDTNQTEHGFPDQLVLGGTHLASKRAKVKSIDSRLKDVTYNVDGMQWEVNNGKLIDVDESIDEIRYLLTNLIDQLELKKASEHVARLVKPKHGLFAALSRAIHEQFPGLTSTPWKDVDEVDEE